ncbi:MAG TPA: pitrilysin family protein [Longimicrobiaceae bacterium]|nr:pitrilysin family protein [Longimicrobiaceae bacterium]
MQIPIERYTLANGLRVVLSEDHANPVVAVNLWYNVGSRDERPGKTGFAHLFEHLMFQGSQNVPDTQHVAHVERAGGSVNGSTWLDRTNYFETVPANRLELALWLESDRMGFFLPAITQEKLDNQRAVVKNERRQRVDNAPYGDWDERLQAMVFPPDHPYHHSVIGSMEDLDRATLDDVREFFRTYYAPNNAVLTICGDFEPAEARRLVETYFGPIPRGPSVPPLPGRPEVPHRIGMEVRDRVEGDVALPRLYLGFRIPPYGTPSFYAADVLAGVLATGKSSRLYRALVRESRIAKDVSSYAFPVVTGAAMLVVTATGTASAGVEALEAAVLAELEALQAAPDLPAEVERAVTGLEARHLIGIQQVGERANDISMYTTHFDDPGRINAELDHYRAVTADDVRRFALEFLRADNRAVLAYAPRARAEAA